MAKILVIDDDPMVLGTIRAMLESAKHHVYVALNGSDGIEIYRQKEVDLVITDIIMPEKEGFATIEDIKREFPDSRIVAISGSSHEGVGSYLEIAKELGADGILHKPFLSEDLLGQVDQFL